MGGQLKAHSAGQGISLHANTANVKIYAKEDVRIDTNTYGLYTRGDSFTYTTGNTNFIADGNTHIQAVRVDINTDGKAQAHTYDGGLTIPTDAYGDKTLIVNRTLLGEPCLKRFPREVRTEVDEYTLFTDVEPDQDTHTLEVDQDAPQQPLRGRSCFTSFNMDLYKFLIFLLQERVYHDFSCDGRGKMS